MSHALSTTEATRGRTPSSRGESRQVLPASGVNSKSLSIAFAIILITLAGLATRLHGYLDRPMWEDEAYTWQDCQVPYLRLLAWKHDRCHGPVSHLLVRHSMQVFRSQAPWVLRLPAFVCGVLCVPAVFWLGSVAGSARLGGIAALLVAVDPNMIDQSQQARMYTMLVLGMLVAAAVSIRLLRNPSVTPGPWIGLGLLLSIPMYINFGMLALWGGFAIAAVASWRQLRHCDSQCAVALANGLRIVAVTTGLLSARALWKFWHFVAEPPDIPAASIAERAGAIWTALQALTGTGTLTVAVLASAVIGLALLYRRSPEAGLLLAATAGTAVAMVFVGRSVSHLIAVRYLSTLGPALWIGLAAAPVFAPALFWRGCAALLVASVITWQGWLAATGRLPEDLTIWRFVRSASELVRTQRADGDLLALAPWIHLHTLGRYNGLLRPEDDRLHEALVQQTALESDLDTRPVWLVAYLPDERSEQAIRGLCAASAAVGACALSANELIAEARAHGLVVMRLAAGERKLWRYDLAEGVMRREQ